MMSTANSLERRALAPLSALNFFMADMQAGIGPFLGVFLLARNWQSGMIGTVMSLGGMAGMMVTAPAGALIDRTRAKRAYVIASGVATLVASASILISQRFWVVAASQIASAVAGAAIGPAVSAITLGIVRQQGFNRQNGKNQAYNHAGNLVGASLSGYLGWKYGFASVFALAALFGVVSIGLTLMIPASSIDHNAARGLSETDTDKDASGLAVLLKDKTLLAMAVALAFFHLGNGAMLPLYGLAAVSSAQADGPGFVALTIVIAQGTMVLMSLLAMKYCERHGYWAVLLLSFLSLPLRGFIASRWIGAWGVHPVQLLDGVGAGLQSVAVPALGARMLQGSGRVNVGLGALMTLQGMGASLSPALGGWIAQYAGYPAAFLLLGSFALFSIGIWMYCAPALKSIDADVAGERYPAS